MSGGSVRVEPPFVDFSNVCVGGVYKTTLTATNIGKGRKKIIIEKPARKLFKFTAAGTAVTVAPGQSVSGLLQFTPEKEEVVRDCLLIHIDDVETIEVPLLGFPRTCSLLTDSVLDFGCVAASRQIISKHHPITNQGSEPAESLQQGATQWLKVELRTDGPGQFDEKALIKLQSFSAVTLTIRAEVVDQRLEVCDLKGDSLSCLRFGPLYYGTSCVKNVFLRNDGPQACDWICLIQDTAAGTEVGTDLRKSTDPSLFEREEQRHPAVQDFSHVLVCAPHQGRLGPHGTTTVAVSFSPFRIRPTTVEHNRSDRRQDYCLFLLFDSVGRDMASRTTMVTLVWN
ncbi:unnamed protein product [Pleuronectes platessa]|uniref:Abnormal spindle-like microcephaly-associated protein ASH domain-containing protein n=1 Tax=Pleuronectes platessa TaxID=8262 RepID=A0A9N7U123_PLEPL|nr:unnamed protein product [Pleuronectes platessa]